jgi:transposase
MRQYFLPPFSFQLNPIETIFVNIKNKLSKKDIRSVEELKG